MLELDVVVSEAYDETSNKFVQTKHCVQLEHSLATVSKWESVFEKPFLGPEEKKQEETLAYIEMMVVGRKLAPEVLLELVKSHYKEIQAYIDRKMTGTKISQMQQGAGRREIITSEIIYAWMVQMRIPFEAQHWHLNKLIMLIRVISVQNSPKKKMTAAERQQLNRQRQAQRNSRG
jgi:hypothetical protein